MYQWGARKNKDMPKTRGNQVLNSRRNYETTKLHETPDYAVQQERKDPDPVAVREEKTLKKNHKVRPLPERSLRNPGRR